MLFDDLIESVFYTTPPPGECDDGVLVECCTDLAGGPFAVLPAGPSWSRLWL